MSIDLEPGDFLYQSDQELFLVCVKKNDDHVLLAAHGWRKIGNDRLEDYLDNDRSKIHREAEIERLIEQQGDEDKQEKFSKLQELFETYEEVELVENGPHTDFALDDQ